MCYYASLTTGTAGHQKMIYDERKKIEFFFSEGLLWGNVIREDVGKIDLPYQHCTSDFQNKIFKNSSKQNLSYRW
jgi:hypothetical protein